MNELKRLAQQAVAAVVVAIVAVVGIIPALIGNGVASANGQVSSRSITMSTSAAGAAASYTVSFTPATTEASGAGLIVDFCSNDPLYNDTCSFTAATVPTVAGSLTTSAGTGTGIGSGTPVHTVQITGLAFTAGSNFSVTISAGITNPTSVGTFYARILTYAAAPNYAPATTTGGTVTDGSFIDYGGDALSVVNNISITAKVFETLTFCVYSGAVCGSAPSLTLGDVTTGALSSSSTYATNETGSNSAQYELATNAGSGVQVVMRGTTLCRSATPATDCQSGDANYNTDTISAIGNTAKPPATNSEQFGMCVDTTGATGGLAAQAPYLDSVNACHGQTTTNNVYAGTSDFGFNDATSLNGTNNAGGSPVLKSSGAVSSYNGSFMFMADDAVTTEAGVYTTSLNMVATSTY